VPRVVVAKVAGLAESAEAAIRDRSVYMIMVKMRDCEDDK